MKAKDNTGGHADISEIGYLVMGRSSIILINSIIYISSFGLMMIYFIVFSGISVSLATYISDSTDKFYEKRYFYVIIVGAIAFPFVI
mmetsp:Transcript_25827/g.25105  ORF Transcript_25827/g.25105 Transcript_25827/m.25105 type:complete len:87 (+) Transcript_25827:292-552(+)